MTAFKLTKETIMSIRDAPVLISGDGASGPWDKNSTLPGSKAIAGEVVMRALAGEARQDDPQIVADPSEKFFEYAWEYLGVRDEEISRAKLIVKILQRQENESEKLLPRIR
jgi:hypothetical protein